MPKIPIYSFQKSLTSEGPNTTQSMEVAGQQGRNMQGFGDVLSKVADRAREVSDINQKVYALKEMDKKSTDLELELANDQDITPEREKYYLDEMAKVKKNLLSYISDPKSRAAADLDFSRVENNLRVKIAGQRYKQIGERAKAEVRSLEEQILQKEAQGLDATDLVNVLEQSKAAYDSKGIYNAEQAQIRDEKWTKERTKNILDSQQALAISGGSKEEADAFIASLKTMEINGKPLSADMQADYAKSTLEALGNMQKRIDAEAKENNRVNRLRVVGALADGSETLESLKNSDVVQRDPELAAVVQNVSRFPSGKYPVTNLDQKAFYDVAQQIVSLNDNDKLNQFFVSSLKQTTPGVTSGTKLGILVALAAAQGKANNPKTAEDVQAGEWTRAIKTTLSAVAQLYPTQIGSISADFLQRVVLKGIQKPEEIYAEAMAVGVDKARDANPSIRHLPAVPNKIVTEDSVDEIYGGENQLQGDEYDGDSDSQSYDQSSSAE